MDNNYRYNSSRSNGSYRSGRSPRVSLASRRTQKKRRLRISSVVILVLLALLFVWLCITAVKGCVGLVFSGDNKEKTTLPDELQDTEDVTGDSQKLSGASETVDENGLVRGTTSEGISYTLRGRGEYALSEDVVTLLAVGDQIANENILEMAEEQGGGVGSGVYDFLPFYREIAPVILNYDLRFINQETVMETEGYDYYGYPSFNTPSAAAEAISSMGFNLVNFATNHIYDYGNAGVEASHRVWDGYPKLLVAGSYLSEEDRQTVQMIERNGITFAFLAYTYGDNRYEDSADMPNTYYNCVFDKDAIKEDVERAQKVADVVIVAMHWGDEYIAEPNDEQWEYAQFLADLDVDLVLGTHAHILQPVKYVTGESGNTVPVVFGLGDLLSGWTKTNTILSGMFTCDFVKDEDGEITIENLALYPLIEWSNGEENLYVRFLKDMTADEINANTRTEDVDNDSVYLVEQIESLNMDIDVIM